MKEVKYSNIFFISAIYPYILYVVHISVALFQLSLHSPIMKILPGFEESHFDSSHFSIHWLGFVDRRNTIPLNGQGEFETRLVGT